MELAGPLGHSPRFNDKWLCMSMERNNFTKLVSEFITAHKTYSKKSCKQIYGTYSQIEWALVTLISLFKSSGTPPRIRAERTATAEEQEDGDEVETD